MASRWGGLSLGEWMADIGTVGGESTKPPEGGAAILSQAAATRHPGGHCKVNAMSRADARSRPKKSGSPAGRAGGGPKGWSAAGQGAHAGGEPPISEEPRKSRYAECGPVRHIRRSGRIEAQNLWAMPRSKPRTP